MTRVPVGLADGSEPDGGRDEVLREGEADRPAASRRAAMPCAAAAIADRDRIGDLVRRACRRARERRGQAASVASRKRAALLARLEMAAPRDGGKREREVVDVAKRVRVAARRRRRQACGEQDRVVAAGAERHEVGQPCRAATPRRVTSPASTAHSRPWRIGEGADREGGRQPGEEQAAIVMSSRGCVDRMVDGRDREPRVMHVLVVAAIRT